MTPSMQRPLLTPWGCVSLAKASFCLLWGSKKNVQGVFLLQGAPGGGSPNATSVHRFPATKSGWNGKTEEKHEYKHSLYSYHGDLNDLWFQCIFRDL